ncbi:hypothetical protein BL241_03430 [Ralstonia solanacearum]|uniref:Uncharacterized protein n=1 Tax=Ralstonia solanacearum TaxID=305 RepID=A0A0S4UBG5_RALSL|nr:hypothetical protein BL241_03430 [Ralstonia solanacearum]CUV19581.1 conserved protein of unknown function [Ralstonia solanacearum]
MPTADPSSEFPHPETILAVRGALAIGHRQGPRGPEGHWLQEFWAFGRARAEADAIIRGFMESTAGTILATSRAYFEILTT